MKKYSNMRIILTQKTAHEFLVFKNETEHVRIAQNEPTVPYSPTLNSVENRNRTHRIAQTAKTVSIHQL